MGGIGLMELEGTPEFLIVPPPCFGNGGSKWRSDLLQVTQPSRRRVA